MTLILHRAEQTGELVHDLAMLLAAPLPDPFVQELVIVPTRGVERWLTQRLSHRLGASAGGSDGVCAGIRFLAPYSLAGMLSGRERDDVWHPDRLVWPLLAVIDESLDLPWAATLARHLGHDGQGPDAEHRAGRRFAVAQRLARLFASYAAQRPAVLADWTAGGESDGTGQAVDADLRWQPHLWRSLLSHVDAPSPLDRHTQTVQALRHGDDPTPDRILPERLSLFGHTRMPLTERGLIEALAAHRDVHLWLPQPSDVLWQRLAAADLHGIVPRAADESRLQVRHPLLASLGRDSRELQRVLPPVRDDTRPLPDRQVAPDTLLGRLQGDLRADRSPEPAGRKLSAHDRSLQVHACHGPARQVEVLREVLTGLLQDDPTLEPRDILVMCPDIDRYAPLFQATFGMGEPDPTTGSSRPTRGHPAHRFRVRLADRGQGATNPLFDLAAGLVDLSGGRVTVSEVRSLLGTEVVRRRFRFDEQDLESITDWIAQAQVRWGLDAVHRERFELGRFGQNTWRFGIDRLLLAVALDAQDGGRVGATLPVDGIASGDIDLVGRLAEFVDRLATTITSLQAARTAGQWLSALRQAVAGLAEVGAENQWQRAQFDAEIAQLVELSDAEMSLRTSDVRQLIRSRLRGRATRSNFRTGTLTVCTMMPMRSVPHRVIALVGLDDGIFPRIDTVDGDDLLARTPLTGERDVRSEDRQLLLDAVLAAQEHLVLTYSGAGEHTGAIKPPAAPLGELIDAARATATWPPGQDVVVRHPLQPFDQRNLIAGELGSAQPFSFDRDALAAARAARAERVVRPTLTDQQLSARTGDLDLAQLVQFFADPVRYFLQQRLEVALPFEQQPPDDAIPLELDALATWQIGDRALREALAGQPDHEIQIVERLRGGIPPGGLGNAVLGRAVADAEAVRAHAAGLRDGPAASLDLDIALPGGRRLTGTVGDIFGTRHVAVGFSTLRARQRLASWVTLLALTTARPDVEWEAVTVGQVRRYRGKGPGHYAAGPLDADYAAEVLRSLVDVHDRGVRGPLPLPLRTSLEYAERLRKRPDKTDLAAQAAQRHWYPTGFGERQIPGERDDPAQLFVHGGPVDFAHLQQQPPLPDEAWNGSTSRLGQFALRVWSPLLDHQRVVHG